MRNVLYLRNEVVAQVERRELRLKVTIVSQIQSGEARTYVVFDALQSFDAVMTEIKLLKTFQVRQPFYLREPI